MPKGQLIAAFALARTSWSRPLVVALAILPVLVVVLLLAPTWLLWPVLPADRQERLLRMCREFANWTRHVLQSATSHEGR